MGRRSVLVLRGAAMAAALLPAAAAGPARAAGVVLELQPRVALRDAPLDVDVTGLRAGQWIVLRAEERSSAGRLWRSAVSVRASAAGTVRLRRARLEGLMHPLGARLADDSYPAVRSTIRVSVRSGARMLAAASVVRLLRQPDVEVVPLRPYADSIYGSYFVPPRASRAAAVVVFAGAEGGLATEAAASLLAAHGHPALALAYFGERGLPSRLEDIPLEYFRRAIVWLRRQPQVQRRRVVVAGASRGGEAALLVGATYPKLVSGVVALVPNDVVTLTPEGGDAWTIHRRPVPTGVIPLTRITAPIFAVGAESDELWPSGAHVRDLRWRLEGHRPTATILDFPDAGHGVGALVPNIPVPTVFQVDDRTFWLGGTMTADERAREVAWPRLLAWLARLG
jgi:dienelactone hydrolase